METRIQKCVMCPKKFKVTIRKSKVLKGANVISDVFCSDKCKKKFKLFIILNDVLVMLEELDNAKLKKNKI